MIDLLLSLRHSTKIGFIDQNVLGTLGFLLLTLYKSSKYKGVLLIILKISNHKYNKPNISSVKLHVRWRGIAVT